jgi:hypothetical protein
MFNFLDFIDPPWDINRGSNFLDNRFDIRLDINRIKTIDDTVSFSMQEFF